MNDFCAWPRLVYSPAFREIFSIREIHSVTTDRRSALSKQWISAARLKVICHSPNFSSRPFHKKLTGSIDNFRL